MAVWRLRRRGKIIVGALAVLACLAALASYLYVRYVDVTRFSAEHGRVTVEAAPVGKLGTALVTNKGFALYMFPPDAARHVTCTGGCATAWPPLLVHAGETITAGPGVRPGLLGTAPNPGGGGSSPTKAGRCTPTWAMPLPVMRPAGRKRRWRLLVRDAPLRADRRRLSAPAASLSQPPRQPRPSAVPLAKGPGNSSRTSAPWIRLPPPVDDPPPGRFAWPPLPRRSGTEKITRCRSAPGGPGSHQYAVTRPAR